MWILRFIPWLTLALLAVLPSYTLANSLTGTPTFEASDSAFNSESGWSFTCDAAADAPPAYISFENLDSGVGGHWRNDLGPGWCNPGPGTGFTHTAFSFTASGDGCYALTSCDIDPGTGSGCPTGDVIAQQPITVGSCSSGGGGGTTTPVYDAGPGVYGLGVVFVWWVINVVGFVVPLLGLYMIVVFIVRVFMGIISFRL